jgi:hypothetical protein
MVFQYTLIDRWFENVRWSYWCHETRWCHTPRLSRHTSCFRQPSPGEVSDQSPGWFESCLSVCRDTLSRHAYHPYHQSEPGSVSASFLLCEVGGSETADRQQIRSFPTSFRLAWLRQANNLYQVVGARDPCGWSTPTCDRSSTRRRDLVARVCDTPRSLGSVLLFAENDILLLDPSFSGQGGTRPLRRLLLASGAT